MFKIASTRPGMYTVRVEQPATFWRWCGWDDIPSVVKVNLTGEELSKLDKVVMNQTYAESKPKVRSAIVFQHASTIWPTHSPDDVTMRTLGAWAVTQYRSNGSYLDILWRYLPCCYSRGKQTRLDLCRVGAAAITNGVPPPGAPAPSDGSSPPPPPPCPTGPQRNKLGYPEPGSGNDDLHPLGGVNDADSEIRAGREDRVITNAAGVGVIGQSTDTKYAKQIVGVVALPVTDPPNVYAREYANIEAAIDNRITRKQRPFTATKDDKVLIGRLVSAAIGNHPRRSLFSTGRVVKWWEERVFDELKSGKWTEQRLQNTIEGLCCRVQPQYKLSCDIKLEPMPEGKAPRMLIADGDEGQVLALLTICCIEDLIKKHLPSKTIKGLGKRPAMERVAKELRAPKTAYTRTKQVAAGKTSDGVSVFEGDGSAWDTTCSAKLRDCVENPVILHVGQVLKALMAQPDSWVDAHYTVSTVEKLAMTFKKNNEFKKLQIDAIRRSGHRGTSCLNWWVNFTCWHCAIFEEPEAFLDPDQRYGKDHTGTTRWLASAFEGDDSILSTTPKIEEKSELYVSLIQRWERLGFNMQIFIRDKRALFTGYYHALDKDGPTGVLMPEVDRCFARAGISCSPTMISHFKDENRMGCMSISRAGALSRAYEFAGAAPTISTKYLRYYESIPATTNIDRELCMKTVGETADFCEPDIVAEILVKNGAATAFDGSEMKRLAAVGFPCTEEELLRFTTRIWDYEVLSDWDGFRESLPNSWRS